MKINPLQESLLMINAKGIGTVTRGMVRQRAMELAVINGRSVHEVSPSDWEQAKRELTGEVEPDAQDTILESAPESERWDPLPGSPGHIAPVTPIDEDDDEGRSIGERLINEGINEAEHDQRVQSGKEQRGTDQE